MWQAASAATVAILGAATYARATMPCAACLVGVSSVLAFAGCVPIASGPYGAHLDAAGKPSDAAAKAAKLKISAGEVTSMSSPYFAELEFTLENPTSRWVRIEKIGLDFGSDKANQLVSLPWGSQLAGWTTATHQRNLWIVHSSAIFPRHRIAHAESHTHV
jgi:hypothetical protein